MNLKEFDELCVENIDTEKIIRDTLHHINNDNNIEEDSKLLARISQQIIINRLEHLWIDFLGVCEFAEFKAISDNTKSWIYKAFMNYYNYIGLNSKVIEYALKFEKLNLSDIDNYEVFNMAAFSLYETGFYEKAIDYIIKSQRAFDIKNVDPIFEIISYNNLVYCYDAIGRVDKMLETYNKFSNIIEIEGDIELKKKMQSVFRMCTLFVKIKIGKEIEKNHEQVFEEYIDYINFLGNEKQYDVMESEDVHLPFIDYAIKQKKYKQAIEICRSLIKSPNVSGFKKQIYKKLIFTYQSMDDKINKQEVFDTIVDYNNVLEEYNDKYDKIMHELVSEEFMIAELEEKYTTMKREYQLDSLTNCYNRKAFDKDIAKSENTRGCVIFMDLDYLKKINDTLGHEAGDIYIRYFAYVTSSIVDNNSKVYRYGGDEFVVISKMGRNEIEITIQKLKNAFSTPCRLNDVNVKLEFSYGIQEFGEGGITLEQAVKIADEKMYKNKKSKR